MNGVSNLATRIEIRHYHEDQVNQIYRTQLIQYSPLRSVDTPVANNPLDATASEPPRSTAFLSAQEQYVDYRAECVCTYPCLLLCRHGVYRDGSIRGVQPYAIAVQSVVFLITKQDEGSLQYALSGCQVRISRFQAWRLSLVAGWEISHVSGSVWYGRDAKKN